MPAPLLLLVRHGQTAWNIQRRVLGRTDIPLDETGLAQAADLPSRIGPVDALWCSPLGRAKQTAAPLAAATGIIVRHDDALVEMDQGQLEGMGEAELLAQHGELVRAWRDAPEGLRLPGGETMDEVADRAFAAFSRIAGAHPAGRIAVVTHQIVLSATVCRLQGLPISQWRHHTHPNTAWAEVEWGETPRVVRTKVQQWQG